MPRTTLDIAAPVLAEAKKLARETGRSLGALVSELLAEQLAQRAVSARRKPPKFHWISKHMGGPRVDLEDKEALYDLLDREAAYGADASDEVAER